VGRELGWLWRRTLSAGSASRLAWDIRVPGPTSRLEAHFGLERLGLAADRGRVAVSKECAGVAVASVVVTPAGGSPEVVFERRVDGSEAGDFLRAAVDLTPFAGTAVRIELVFESESDAPSGPFAFWAEPFVTREGSGSPPSVLVLMLDTLRADRLGCYGAERDLTPNLDRLAGRGVRFANAVSAAPWTLPSHASVFTGLWPHEHGADWRAPLDKRAPTLAEVLARRGYRTGGFVANLVLTSREHGLHRGFQVYRDYRRSPGALLRSASLVQTIVTSKQLRRLTSAREVTGRKQAHHVNDEFLAWEGDADDGPWFAFLNYYDAHEPYLPRAPYAGRYSAGLPPRRFDRQVFWHVEGLMGSWEGLRPDEVEAERAAYEEAITGLDAAIGEMLSELRRRGSLERTSWPWRPIS
jgi:hypothetical protein